MFLLTQLLQIWTTNTDFEQRPERSAASLCHRMTVGTETGLSYQGNSSDGLIDWVGRDVAMSLRSRTSTADDVESRHVVVETLPDEFQGGVVVTLEETLNFALFFFVCFLISFLVGGWLLGFL